MVLQIVEPQSVFLAMLRKMAVGTWKTGALQPTLTLTL
jgi:hypothetical protein